MGANRTSFKKGHTPARYRELYSERTSVDGIVEIKVERNKWISKHRYVWEKYHNRKYKHILKDKELMRSCVDLSELIYAIGKRKKTEENEN